MESSNWRDKSDPEICDTFSHCKLGSKSCRNKHNQKRYEQTFFIAKIISMRSGVIALTRIEMGNETKDEKFHISHEYLSTALTAKNLDTVLFQASTRTWHGNVKFGRIVANLGRTQSENHVPLEQLQQHAFTFDYPGTKRRDDALSIEECKRHENCKKFGIHVAAVAMGKQEKTRHLPVYGKKFRAECSWVDEHGFDLGQITPSLSVFSHSSVNDIEGPIIVPVKVEQNYTFDKRYEYQERLDELWSHFVGTRTAQCLTEFTGGKNYINFFPKYWKEMAILGNISWAYSQALTGCIPRKIDSVFIVNVVAREREPVFDDTSAAFKDILIEARNAIKENQDNCDELIAKAIPSIRRSAVYHHHLSENFFPLKYVRDVMHSRKVTQMNPVKAKAPLRNFQHFVNQQMLIGSLVGIGNLYSEEDLLGMLVIRQRTPAIVISDISNVTECRIQLVYYGDKKVDESLHSLHIESISEINEACRGNSNKRKVLLRGTYCNTESYCNRTLFHVSGKYVVEMTRNIKESGKVLPETRKLFLEMCDKAVEESSPYSQHEKGTLLTLQRGVELQVQTSHEDAKEHNDLGFRLLRVGRDCHVCFIHLNHPEKAFMTDRVDIRKLINNETIYSLKEARKAGTLVYVVLQDVDIEWKGEYLSGGHFQQFGNKEPDIRAGDLLCFRKEKYLRNSDINYVWMGHGVVSGVDGSKFEFALCTLSQEEGISDTSGFCIELIKNPCIND